MKVLAFNSMESISVLLGIILSFSGTKISRIAEHKVAGAGSKTFANGSLGVKVTSTSSFLDLQILAVGDTAQVKYCFLADTELHLSKATPPFNQSNCFWVVSMISSMNFSSMSPLAHFFGREAHFLVRSNASGIP